MENSVKNSNRLKDFMKINQAKILTFDIDNVKKIMKKEYKRISQGKE